MKRHTPLRMCMVCREMLPKAELIRVASLEDEVVIDCDNKVQARGCYVCNGEDCIKQFRKRRCLERAFKKNIDPCIYDEIEKLI